MNGVGLGARSITSLASGENDKQPAQLFNTAVTAATKAASTNEFPAVLFFTKNTRAPGNGICEKRNRLHVIMNHGIYRKKAEKGWGLPFGGGIMRKAGARIDFLKKEHKHVKRRNTTKHYA